MSGTGVAVQIRMELSSRIYIHPQASKAHGVYQRGITEYCSPVARHQARNHLKKWAASDYPPCEHALLLVTRSITEPSSESVSQ
jgi:hypothetical protein